MAAELTKKEKIAILSSGIIAAHKGQAAFNATETAKIVGIDKKFIGPEFDEHGVLAIRQKQSKYYTAVAIAEYLYAVQISPLQPCRRSNQVN